MKTIEVQGLTLNIRSFGFFSIAIISDLNEEIGPTIKELGFRFICRYGELMLEKNLCLNKFQPFKKSIRDVFGTKFDESGLLWPFKFLNTRNVFKLPFDQKTVALAMIY